MTVERAAGPECVDRVIARRLRQFQLVTGLPVVFGGPVTRSPREVALSIAHLRGAIGPALEGLRVDSGLGLGGAAIERGDLCRVSDYQASESITHHYDPQIVHAEKLKSVLALPIQHRGAVAGVLYGAVRTDSTIGDSVLASATAFTESIERELQRMDPGPIAGAASGGARVRCALDELAELARSSRDPWLRRKLQGILNDLTGSSLEAAPSCDVNVVASAEGVHLAPRELETIKLIAIGMTNRQAAESMGLSAETVKAYMRSAMKRLGVANRTAAVHVARAKGIV